MRTALLAASCLFAIAPLWALAPTSQEASTVEASTEQAPGAPGWDGRLPLPVYAAPDAYGDDRYGGGYGGGGNVNVFIDNSIHLGGRYRLGGSDYSRHECSGYDLSRGGNRTGLARTGGYISGGTYQSGPRCRDAYPGLPLRPLPYGNGGYPPAQYYAPALGAR
ncbi:MAG: hypothetical protein V4709_12750 [Pseudomonadota bacterium]